MRASLWFFVAAFAVAAEAVELPYNSVVTAAEAPPKSLSQVQLKENLARSNVAVVPNMQADIKNAAAAKMSADTALKSAVAASNAANAAARNADLASATSTVAVAPRHAVVANTAAADAARAAGTASTAAVAAAHNANQAANEAGRQGGDSATYAAAANEAAAAAVNAASQAATAAFASAEHGANAAKTLNGSTPSVVLAPRTAEPAIVEAPTGLHQPLTPNTPVEQSWMAGHMPNVHHYIFGFTFASFIKVVCMTGNILVQISPYPTVRKWEDRKCTGDVDAAPFLSIAFGGFQWCFYGTFAWLLTKRSGFLILVQSNCLGAMLGTYYTMAFARNCRHVSSMLALNRYTTAVASLAGLQIASIVVLPLERALFLVGLISSFCSFVGALSMLVAVPTVVRTKSSRTIPGPYAVANLLCAIAWVICGWVLGDPLVTYPNIASAISSGVCLYLKITFPEPDDKDSDDEGALNKSTRVLGKMGQKGRPHSEFTPFAHVARTMAARSAALQAATASGSKSDAAQPSSSNTFAADSEASALLQDSHCAKQLSLGNEPDSSTAVQPSALPDGGTGSTF